MKRPRSWLESLRFLGLAGALSMFIHPAGAQSTSVVEGTLVDASNAAVPEAKVTLTSQARQVAYRSTSNNLGVFRVTTLPLGIYRVEIEATGFKPWVETDLALEAGQVRTLNVALEVGAAQQTVEVRATANAVETGKAATSAEISPVTIQQAPLFSRNIFTGLVAMVSGVTAE